MSTLIGPRLDAVVDFVKQRQAERVKQGGAALMYHLAGTYDLLAQNGAAAEVCLAGWLQSVYGTDSSKDALATLEERPVVAALAGERAERLAHALACLTQREAAIRTLAEQGRAEVRLRGDTAPRVIEGQDARDIVTIECASVLERLTLNFPPHLVHEARRNGMVGPHGFVPFRRRNLETLLRQDGAAVVLRHDGAGKATASVEA